MQSILGFQSQQNTSKNKESSKIFVHVLLNNSSNFIKQYLYYFFNILNRLEQNILFKTKYAYCTHVAGLSMMQRVESERKQVPRGV